MISERAKLEATGVGMQEGAPRISVVVPTYNRADLVLETLAAVFAQSLPAYEVIVVDDGSTDATAHILEGCGPRIRVIRIANSGDLVARNKGLQAATGELVAFCDSDDLWRPGFLAAMAGLWRAEPGLRAAYGNFRSVQEDRWDERSKFDDAPPGFWADVRCIGTEFRVFDHAIIEQLLTFQPFFPSAMMVDREAFTEAGGWDESVSRIVGTDFATALRVAEGKVGLVLEPLVGIRRHHGNFSADTQAMNLGDARILECVLATRPSLARYREAILASIADRRAAAADLAFDRRDFRAMRQIHSLLPASHRPLRRSLKRWISGLPAPLATGVARLSSWAA